jgi:kumamolisin
MEHRFPASDRGGVSNNFELPSWQGRTGVPARYGTGQDGRGVPDVAANADAMTGYEVPYRAGPP